MADYGRIRPERRSGHEHFCDGVGELGFDLLSFWQWSSSDVVSNATRGILAEYLVAQALGAAAGVRDEWAAYDLLLPDETTVEVKSAAYVQSWHQDRLSTITFGCRKTLAWDPETNQMAEVKCRQAEVYVFALLAHKDQATLDPLDVAQWEFYVIPTAWLDRRTRSQHSITLSSLRSLHERPPLNFSDLAEAVAEAANIHRAVLAANQAGETG